MKHKEKATNISREEKLRNSLPEFAIDDAPVFPKIKVKEKHDVLPYALVAIAVAALVVFHMVFAIARVDGLSMSPTLHNNQMMLLARHQKIQRFDIIVLKERIANNGSEKAIVKRAIGFPGDVITVIDGKLYINNKQYDESYLANKNIKNFKKVDWTIRVPKGHIFVLGDNRDISKDSRVVGSFDKSAVVGVKILGKNQ